MTVIKEQYTVVGHVMLMPKDVEAAVRAAVRAKYPEFEGHAIVPTEPMWVVTVEIRKPEANHE